MAELKLTLDSLWTCVLRHDDDGDSTITEQEFNKFMTAKETAMIMKSVGVDLDGLVKVSSFVFDQHDGAMSKNEFLGTILDLRGNNKASVKDHVETRNFIHKELHKVGLMILHACDQHCPLAPGEE
eukprot:CAMPEP_0172885430 /NCGR_PEP_ID=MMETSP1075-20121228/128007_1 /TAXON_ID=2916 /ORGANISM="Ceratium fusus, Strain PA161109" /LENGTH=125 /DNA_ID=CAMNT_0013738713 /DNA_START=35 /DNA_END=412 /DNA_ORIENTATION=-